MKGVYIVCQMFFSAGIFVISGLSVYDWRIWVLAVFVVGYGIATQFYRDAERTEQESDILRGWK